MATPYQLAAGMAGTREGQSALTDYLRTGGQNIDPATRAWCADFVNATLNKAGQKGTDSGMARSFLKWGEAVTGAPQQGDVAVFSRGSDPAKGHVGFFDSINPDGTIKVLGGNQSDSVSFGDYPAERLLGYRRPSAPDGPKGQESYPPPGSTPAAPVFGSMAPMADTGIDPNVAKYASADEKDTLGNRLQKAGKFFGEALDVQAPRPGPFPGGPSAAQATGLLKATDNIKQLAQMLMQRRMV